jgi:hypothetical protein
MPLELCQEVALTRDLPEYELKVGDVATLVDLVAHPTDSEERYVMRGFQCSGRIASCDCDSYLCCTGSTC